MRLSEESEVALEVELARLPLDDGVDTVAEMVGLSGPEFAASAGEDYELLLTAQPAAREAVESAAQQAGTAITWIGRTRAGAGLRLLDDRGMPRSLGGWDHLAARAGVDPLRRSRASR
jgi:thiamine-monophosphate kinase